MMKLGCMTSMGPSSSKMLKLFCGGFESSLNYICVGWASNWLSLVPVKGDGLIVLRSSHCGFLWFLSVDCILNWSQ